MPTSHRATAKKSSSFLDAPTEAEARKPAANRVGRPTGRDSQQTRLAILDVAEALLSERGYEGASIRDIAAGCQVQAAAIGYHYASKMDLFNAVVARRALIINEARSLALDAELLASKGRALRIEVLVHHYASPLLEATSHGDPGWRNFASLMGRLANSPRGTDMINQHFKGVAERYMREFARALPALPPERLADGFLYMVSSMLVVCAGTGRWEAMLGRTALAPRDSSAILSDLVPFVAGGFRAMVGTAKAPSPKSAKVCQSPQKRSENQTSQES
jgi:AcrR family transcriptional regulator